MKTTWNYHTYTGELESVDYNDSTPDIAYLYDRLGRQQQITQIVATNRNGHAIADRCQSRIKAS